MSRRIEELESENNELRKRIAELEAASRKSGNANTSPKRATQVLHNSVFSIYNAAKTWNIGMLILLYQIHKYLVLLVVKVIFGIIVITPLK